MKIFVAGATGAVGKRLVPLLVASGYDVVAMTRSREKVDSLHMAGVEPVVADGLDGAEVMEAQSGCRSSPARSMRSRQGEFQYGSAGWPSVRSASP